MSVLTRYHNLRSKYRTAGSRLHEEQGAYTNLLQQQKKLQESTYGKGSDSLQSKWTKAGEDVTAKQTEMYGSEGYKDWVKAKQAYSTASISAYGETGTGGEYGTLKGKYDTAYEKAYGKTGTGGEFGKLKKEYDAAYTKAYGETGTGGEYGELKKKITDWGTKSDAIMKLAGDRTKRFTAEDYLSGSKMEAFEKRTGYVTYHPSNTFTHILHHTGVDALASGIKRYDTGLSGDVELDKKMESSGSAAFDDYRKARREWRRAQVEFRSGSFLDDWARSSGKVEKTQTGSETESFGDWRTRTKQKSFDEWLGGNTSVTYDPDGTPVHKSRDQMMELYNKDLAGKYKTGIESGDVLTTPTYTESIVPSFDLEDMKTKLFSPDYMELDHGKISDYGVFEDLDFKNTTENIYKNLRGWATNRPDLWEKWGGEDFTRHISRAFKKLNWAGQAFYGKDGKGGATQAYQAWGNTPSAWTKAIEGLGAKYNLSGIQADIEGLPAKYNLSTMKLDLENIPTKYGLNAKKAAVKSAYEGEAYSGYRTKLAELTSTTEGYERQIKGPAGADAKLAKLETDIGASQARIRQYGGNQALLAMSLPGAMTDLAFARETRKRGTRESAFRTTTLTSRSPYRY